MAGTLPTAVEGQTVRLEVPARSGYVVLARLALSAVCRLTSLEDEDVADLKLAITEAAATFVQEEEAPVGPLQSADAPPDEETVRFSFALGDRQLVVEVSSEARAEVSDEDRELSRAILHAVVDECEATDGSIRLVKRLPAAAE